MSEDAKLESVGRYQDDDKEFEKQSSRKRSGSFWRNYSAVAQI